MSPAHIELFIDRLCGLFPTTNIARNTLKNGWTKDETLLYAPEDHAKKVLAKCEQLPNFPNFATVKTMFRAAAGIEQTRFGCPTCSFTGWDEGLQIVTDENGDEQMERYTMFDAELQHTYRYVKPCPKCRQIA